MTTNLLKQFLWPIGGNAVLGTKLIQLQTLLGIFVSNSKIKVGNVKKDYCSRHPPPYRSSPKPKPLSVCQWKSKEAEPINQSPLPDLPISFHGHTQPKPELKPGIYAGPNPPTAFSHSYFLFFTFFPNHSDSLLLLRPSLDRRRGRGGLHWTEPGRVGPAHQSDPRLQRVRVGQSG